MSETEWLALAAHLARCAPDEVMAFRVRDDGGMIVVIQPGPKYIYTPEQVEAAKAEMRPKPPAAPQPPPPEPPPTAEAPAAGDARRSDPEPPPAEPSQRSEDPASSAGPPPRARRRNF